MVTLQDISVQLMKPVKVLADWKFPLSKILEEYYTLLDQPCDINFGEAALVLQNSTNVYVQRIDCLLNQTGNLRQKFFAQQQEENNKLMHKKKRNLKKTNDNLDNFTIIDIENDVGKNIDKKNQFQIQKKLKLLNRQFTQLEKNMTQLSIPIQVYDVLGEVIGKKYDFLCNQAVNTSGMLIDELTPYDSTCTLNSCIPKGTNTLSSHSELITPSTGTSGYHSLTLTNNNDVIVHDNDSIMHNYNDDDDDNNDHNDFENERNSLLESNSPTNELELMEKENMINNNNECSFAKNMFSQTSAEKENVCNENSLIQNTKEINQIRRESQNEDSIQMNETNEGNRSKDKSAIEFEIKHKLQLNKLVKPQKEDRLPATRKRRNQTTKKLIPPIHDTNEHDWKPMSLSQGIRCSYSKNSSILKLPDYISFLETEFGSRKRKITSKLCKPECLTRFVLRDTTLLEKQDDTFQIKQKIRYLEKKDLEEFMTNFDQHLCIEEGNSDNTQYKAVSNVSTDLLGFLELDQANGNGNTSEDITSRSPSPMDVTLQPTISQNFDTIAKSPDSCFDWCEPTESENVETNLNCLNALLNYEALIENKMKEIAKESDKSRTELDKNVANWHASLQEKLSENETRPEFRIHDYTSHIIEAFSTTKSPKINFDSIVQDKPTFEVVRYFIASLHLANAYEVDINVNNCDNN